MHKITVSKDDLLETLIENKRKHRETYAEACEAYSEQMAKYLDRLADLFADGEMPTVDLHRYPRPQQFLDEYDEAIQMLEWHSEDEITLTNPEFKQFVMDEWGWKGQFAATSLAYTE